VTSLSIGVSVGHSISTFNNDSADLAHEQQQNVVLSHYRPLPPRKIGIQKDLVKPGDYIYYKADESWDSAPIVIESKKLIFFTVPKVGCTVWKQLFRRMMKETDWSSQDYEKMLPHNPQENGLQYLYDYTVDQASEMMSSSEWTRAIMVHDPKERFFSAFLDKSIRNDHKHIIDKCCPNYSCVSSAQMISGFLELCARCNDDHWQPQDERVNRKYWPYLDYILHVEDTAEEAEKILTDIGAWDDYGKSGWGLNGTSAIFESKGLAGAGVHTNYAKWQMWKWYTPDTEKLVQSFYQRDYENPLFNFTRGLCVTCYTEAA
jgi:hypothetical protein